MITMFLLGRPLLRRLAPHARWSTTSLLSDLIADLEVVPQMVPGTGTEMDVEVFEGQSRDLGWGRVFGGQIIAQAMLAAQSTVDDDGDSGTSSDDGGSTRNLHSLHGYFARPGDVSEPVRYEVTRLLDGRSFSSRTVHAYQPHGLVFTLSCSFQVEEEGFEHQDSLPTAGLPPPEECTPREEYWAEHQDRMKHLPPPMRERLLARKPILVKPIETPDPLLPEPTRPVQHVWIKARSESEPAGTSGGSGSSIITPRMHQALLAYATDFSFLPTALQPHGLALLSGQTRLATIDHSLWIHRPSLLRMDDWLLHQMHSPSASNGRGICFGRIYTRDGQLVASTAQEGLLRRDRRRNP